MNQRLPPELRELIGHYLETNLLLQFLFHYVSRAAFYYAANEYIAANVQAVNKVLAQHGMISNIGLVQRGDETFFQPDLNYMGVAPLPLIQELVTLIYGFTAEKVDFIAKLNGYCQSIGSHKRFFLIDVNTRIKIDMVHTK